MQAKTSIKTLLIFSSMLILFLAGCSGSKSTTVVQGSSPVIQSLSVVGLPAATGGAITATVVASSAQSLALTYTWTVSSGWSVSSGGSTTTATISAPAAYAASGMATVEVSDTYGRYALNTFPLSTVGNGSPVINGFTVSPNPVPKSDLMALSVSATDPDGDTLSYTWQASNGWTIATGQGTSGITVTAPDQYGVSGTVTVTVDDGHGGTASLSMPVRTYLYSLPVIAAFSISPQPVITSTTLSCTAYGQEGDPLISYEWTVGGIPMFTGATAEWDSPGIPGNYTVSVAASLADGGTSVSSSTMSISSTSVWPKFHRDIQSTGLSPIDTSADTGTLKWSYPTGGGISSSPAIGADGTIYVGSWDKKLYAINPSTGVAKWTFTTGNSVDSSPAIGADGTIYVGSGDNKLYAINPTGTLKWSYPTGGGISSSPAIGADGAIYVGSSDHNVYAINPVTGAAKWTFTTGNAVYSSPAIGADGTIYVGSYDHNVYAINPATGAAKWTFTTGNAVYSSPAIGADGTIYVGSYDHNVYAINPATGAAKWTFTTGSLVYSSPAIGADGTIYVGSVDHKLYAINPATGAAKWTFTAGNSVSSSPAIGADGTIYVGSGDGKLYAINPATGAAKWTFTTGNVVFSSPAIGADGTIYVGSYDTKLYAIH